MQIQKWGDFEIHEVLGKGGMGIVYRGRQISLDRAVAVKVLPTSFTERKDFIQRFYREAKAVAQINCPQIIQVYGAGEYEGKHYFAMEYIEGEDLGEKLKRNEVFEFSRILFLVKETAKALAAAGEKNIIHRDIKPGNIMITKQGKVKVMDFGLAKFTTDATELTQAGVVMGTVNYLSPEQGQGKKVDQRTDIYSLGIVMYELLTGEIPFKGDNASSVIYQHIHTPPPLPSKKKNGIPREIEAIVMKCLHKDPNDRYFTARELIRDIEAIESGRIPQTVIQDSKKRKRNLVKKTVAVCTVFIIAGGIGILGWLGYRPYIKPLMDKVLNRDRPAADQQDEKKAEEERKKKEIEIELTAVKEQARTQDPEELDRLQKKLEDLKKRFPENREIMLISESVREKAERITERKKNIRKVEQLLDGDEYAQAEILAAKLYDENPKDLILENLFKRVQTEKTSFYRERKKQEQLEKKIEAAEELNRLGSYSLALRKYEDVLLLDPRNKRALKGMETVKAAIAEADKQPDNTSGDDKPKALTAAEQISITECTNYYNEAEKFYQQRDYDNALLYAEKALNVDGIGHIPEAVEKKKQAVTLKNKIESELSSIQKQDMLNRKIEQLKKSAEKHEARGREPDAVSDLKNLVNLDPDNAEIYRKKIEQLNIIHDTKTSTACVRAFNEHISAGSIEKIAALFNSDSKEFCRTAIKEFSEYLETFSSTESRFTVESVRLSDDRNSCTVTGLWTMSFAYKTDDKKVASDVTCHTVLSLVKKDNTWYITGAKANRK